MESSMINKCKLCLQNKKLCNSHIISEFLFKPGYDEKHRLKELKANTGKSKYIQKGIREYLLCSNCENLISKWEKYSSVLLENMKINEKMEAVYLKERNYKYFKLFHLSILWKASIANGSEFCSVSLGHHEEKLRKKLLNEDAGQSDFYPIIGRMLVDDKKRTDGFIIAPVSFKQDSFRVYTFIFGSCQWFYFTGSHSIEQSQISINEFLLKENGSMILPIYPWNENPSVKNFFEHFYYNKNITK
jgi:hypothetical protein